MIRSGALLIYIVLLLLVPLPAGSQETDYSSPYELAIPDGILPPIIPDENPVTVGKVALGRKLYFDKRLSIDNTVSCATCHDPRKGFGDGKALAEGVGGQKGARNSPTTLNAAFYDFQFWDGRVETLEEQAKQPLINPVEMAMPSQDAVVEKVRGIEGYPEFFEKVYGTKEITIDHIAGAIASFERTLIEFNSPFDWFIAGNANAISESAKRGWDLFNGKARCNSCHGHIESYPFFTDNKFHNIGVGAKDLRFEELARRAEQESDISKLTHEEGASELGRYLVTRNKADIGAFKTPGLRNIALTAPYMHDGSEPTLTSVIEFYNKGGEPNPFLDGGIVPLELTEEEVADLVEFMKSLTSLTIAEFEKEFSADME